MQHMFQDFVRDMVIERSKDATKFPSGEQSGQDVGVIFADDSDDGFGAISLMKFEESGGDGIEVAIGPRFVATLENIMFNAIRSGNRNKMSKSVLPIERIEAMGIIDSDLTRDPQTGLKDL